MYAVVRVGGKQQRVEPGDVIEVEYMKKLDPGSTVELDTLFVMEDGTVHRPKGGTVKVVGRLVGEKKGDKIKVFKYRNKSGYARTQGHRQLMTELEIEEIVVGDKVLRKPEPAQEAATGSGEDAKKTTAKKTTAKKTSAKKTTSKKTTAKKTSAKKTTAKKTTAKKTTAKKSTARKKT